MTAEGEEGEWELAVSAETDAGEPLPTPGRMTVRTGGGRSVCAAEWTLQMPAGGAVTLNLTARQVERVCRNRYILLVKNAGGVADRSLLLAFAPTFEELAGESRG